MSLTSYQAAPPRVVSMSIETTKSNRKCTAHEYWTYEILAPAVGFEPTTNRLTADRSTTELRWIISLFIEIYNNIASANIWGLTLSYDTTMLSDMIANRIWTRI